MCDNDRREERVLFCKIRSEIGGNLYRIYFAYELTELLPDKIYTLKGTKEGSGRFRGSELELQSWRGEVEWVSYLTCYHTRNPGL